VTRRGRDVLELICRELAARGVTLLEADTDGVYFAVPEHFTEADERRVVSEVGALLPSRVKLEFDGRYAAMLSHEPKNYALMPFRGAVVLRGVAFRSSRAEPFGETFLRRALTCLLTGDLSGVRNAYVDTMVALRRRRIPTFEVSARVRLTKTPAEYLATRKERRELPYEAVLRSGCNTWTAGERVRVYRTAGGEGGVFSEVDTDEEAGADPDRASSDARDYDVEYYTRLLRETFAARLARALSPEGFSSLFADPDRPSLFDVAPADLKPILTVLGDPATVFVKPL
jgi:DNA polymerase, archaea type